MPMDNAEIWYFPRDLLANDTPSRRQGIDQAKELSYRQQAANFIQDMGQRLQLSQLCINTAIVYMHRMYMYQSFTDLHRNNLSVSGLFLAAKLEEQPRKLEHVIKVAHVCLHKDAPPLDVRSEAYAEKMYEVVAHENILLQTLGFTLAIEHPHTYVVKVCQLVKASKDLAQTSYIMATTSLHMTTMCVQYKPTVVACVCIHLACKWSSYMIEPCSEGRDWFYYVDRNVTWDLLEELTQEFIAILETSPHRFKRKFGKDPSAYVPRCIMDNSQPGPSGCSSSNKKNKDDKDAKPSTSSSDSKIVLLAIKDRASPGPSTSLQSFDLSADLDEKPPRSLKYDSPEMRISKYDSPERRVSKYDSPDKRLSKYCSPEKLACVSKYDSPEKPRPIKVESPERPPIPPPPPPPPDVPTALPPLPPLPPTPQMLSPIKDIKPSIVPPHPRKQSPPPLKDAIKTNGSKSTIDKAFHAVIDNLPIPSKRTSDSSNSKHERREKHKTKHSSKDRHSSNHSEQPPSIKVKIRRDIISLKPAEPSQKPPIKPESPKKSIKIKLPKPPAPEPPKPSTPASIKLVLTKDKSGSGFSFSASSKSEHRESRKRSHSNALTADGHKNSHESSSKYSKMEHSSQRGHSGDPGGAAQRQGKISRHSGSHGHSGHQSNLRQSLPVSHLAHPPLPPPVSLPPPPPLPPPE